VSASPQSNGPNFTVDHDGRRFYIEATTPEQGHELRSILVPGRAWPKAQWLFFHQDHNKKTVVAAFSILIQTGKFRVKTSIRGFS